MGKHSAQDGHAGPQDGTSGTAGADDPAQDDGRGRRGPGPEAAPAGPRSAREAPSARRDDPPGPLPHPEHAAWGAALGTAGESRAPRGPGAGTRPQRPDDRHDTGAHDTGQWAAFVTRSSAVDAGRVAGQITRGTAGRGTFSGPRATRPGEARVPGPRAEFVRAFEDPPVAPGPAADAEAADAARHEPPGAGPSRKSGGRGRAFTGAAAAAVVTVLAVVIAGHVAGTDGKRGDTASADDLPGRPGDDSASRSKDRPVSSVSHASYETRLATAHPLDPGLRLGGSFHTMPGHDAAPGHGKRYRVRVDVENGLELDDELFAQAVFRTLNDERSWSHGGAKTFERVSSGHADLVVTLASPGTTAKWCAKSGLDTSEENVSCDAASTERTMINAYRWAQGSETFGPARLAEYRQMLINHEVGHRLGHNHEPCPRDGALAPVMMQQTKFLTLGGHTCRPNAWPFPQGGRREELTS